MARAYRTVGGNKGDPSMKVFVSREDTIIQSPEKNSNFWGNTQSTP